MERAEVQQPVWTDVSFWILLHAPTRLY